MRIPILAALALVAMACGPAAEGKKEVEKPRAKKQDRAAAANRALKQAIRAEERDEPNKAERQYARAYKLRPSHHETVKRYVAFLIARNQRPKAIELANEYLNGAPDETKRYHILADVQIADRDWLSAHETLTQLLDLDAEDGQAWSKRGTVQSERDSHDEAIADMQKALSLEAENPDFRAAYGEVLLNAGQMDKAAIELRGAIQIDPEHGEAHTVLGEVLRKQKEFDDALATLQQAVKFAPGSARAYFQLGLTQNRVGDNLGAELSMKQATELEPGNSKYWYAYGEVLRALKRYSDAGPFYRKALEIEPDHSKAANKLGVVLFLAGDYAEAEAVLTERVRKFPEDVDPYYNLGVVYAQLEKYKLALEALERYLQIAPKTDRNVADARQQVRVLKRKVRSQRR
ncbi:MAG: tetratricopeptide repeat protein [Myxococcota bacterium]